MYCRLRVLVCRRAQQKATMHITSPSSMTRAILNPANWEKIKPEQECKLSYHETYN